MSKRALRRVAATHGRENADRAEWRNALGGKRLRHNHHQKAAEAEPGREGDERDTAGIKLDIRLLLHDDQPPLRRDGKRGQPLVGEAGAGPRLTYRERHVKNAGTTRTAEGYYASRAPPQRRNKCGVPPLHATKH